MTHSNRLCVIFMLAWKQHKTLETSQHQSLPRSLAELADQSFPHHSQHGQGLTPAHSQREKESWGEERCICKYKSSILQHCYLLLVQHNLMYLGSILLIIIGYVLCCTTFLSHNTHAIPAPHITGSTSMVSTKPLTPSQCTTVDPTKNTFWYRYQYASWQQ